MVASDSNGQVLLIGNEPAAFSAALTLAEAGLSVRHVHETPFGLDGASRDIGLVYPELGEPWERLEYALGQELALEFQRWGKNGVENLIERLPASMERGSRLSIARTELEGNLLASDAVKRSQQPVCDDVRLMSGAAASNYAPIDGAHLASFETHALNFVPVKVCEKLASQLSEFTNYRAIPLESDQYKSLELTFLQERVALRGIDGLEEVGDLCLLGTSLETRALLGRFDRVLLPLTAVAFRSQPLKERTRTSVVGITAGWGSERYRFDTELRLLGCGINPSQDFTQASENDNKSWDILRERATQLFTDFHCPLEELLRWSLNFTITCDGLPLLGPLPGEPRVQLCVGFGSSAWSRGWEAGRRLAQAIAGSGEEIQSPLMERCNSRRFFK